ncbi:MAG: MFS transporter [Actinomycetota bacterium]|nr:MFS transporter [Actinomycetota bacterium]
MRRLLLLVSALVLVDTMLYAALTPLLPHYAEEFGLSKQGAGALVATYAFGALVGGLPGGIAAARFGPRRAVLIGLALMTVAGVAFAFADSPWMLGVARFGQGFGSALTWSGSLTWLVAATPRERRGEAIGSAMGAAIFGALLGPVLGAAASFAGAQLVFSCVAALGLLLGIWAFRTETVPPDPQPIRALGRAFREPRISAGLWLMVLPALLFGILSVLAPLALSRAGWGAVAIGAVFLVGASLEALLSPAFGRLSDRRGRLYPLRIAIVAAAAVTALLAVARPAPLTAVLVVCAALAFGGFWTPAMALISDGAERSGLAQGLGFGLMNLAWAAGNSVGPSAGGLLADRAGDAAPYLIASALCLGTLGASLVGLRTRAAARSR